MTKSIGTIKYDWVGDKLAAYVDILADYDYNWNICANGTDPNGDHIAANFLVVDNLVNPTPVVITASRLEYYIPPYTRSTYKINSLSNFAVNLQNGPITIIISPRDLGIPSESNQYLSGNVFDMAQYLLRDGTTSLTANWDIGGFLIKNAASPIAPGDVTTKSYVDYNLPWLSVKTIGGATADGATDDSDAILATIAYGDANYPNGYNIFFPPTNANYKITKKISFTKSRTGIIGSGQASPIYTYGDFGDVFYFKPAAGPNLYAPTISNLYVYCQSDTTNGAILHLEDVNMALISGCDFNAHYGGIFFDGVVHSYIVATNLASDANFAADRAGSFLFKVGKSAAGTLSAENHAIGGDWRGQTVNYRLNYSIFVTACDGLWLHGQHIGMAKVGLALLPANDASILISVNTIKMYVDTCNTDLVQVFRPTATYDALFGGHDLEFSQLYNTQGQGINWFCKAATLNNNEPSFISIGWAYKIGASVISIGLGRNITLREGFQFEAFSYVTAGVAGIVLSTATVGNITGINIGRGVLDKKDSPNVPNAGLQVTNNVTEWRTDQLRVINCGATILDASTTPNKDIVAAKNW